LRGYLSDNIVPDLGMGCKIGYWVLDIGDGGLGALLDGYLPGRESWGIIGGGREKKGERGI
jgi:hypothetical protein